jgi:ABC-type glycerol-3-phosphate transport system substrate-binding protein
MIQKKVRFLVTLLIISQLLLAACTTIVPTGTQPDEPTLAGTTATPTNTQESAENTVPTATPFPTIAITDKLLKGLDITVRHPFFDESDEFNKLVRDFNLNNLWGIHVTGVASGGTVGLANDLKDGLVDDDLVIGMGTDLLAAPPDTQLLALDNYARDSKFGVTGFFDARSPFSEFAPKFGETVHYTIPLAYNAGILLYNQGWAEELGFASIPTSRDDLLSLAQAAKDANLVDANYYNNGTGGLYLSQTPLSAQSWYRSYGGEFGTQDGAFVPQPEPLLASFNFLKSAFDANQSWVGVEPTSYRYFSDRYAVITEGTLESLPFQAAYQQSGNFQDAWTTLSYIGSDGESYLVLEPLAFSVQRSDQNSELAAWIFANWLMEPAQQARLVEIHGLWPSTGDPTSIAPEYASTHPYWAAALESDPIITVVPEDANWASVRLVFQDAYQRIFNLDSEYFINILDVFGQTTQINQEQRP